MRASQTAQAVFRAFGVEHLEYCAIDDEPDVTRFDLLDRYDVVYLTGGDPLLFRQNLRRSGFGERLREFMAASLPTTYLNGTNSNLI